MKSNSDISSGSEEACCAANFSTFQLCISIELLPGTQIDELSQSWLEVGQSMEMNMFEKRNKLSGQPGMMECVDDCSGFHKIPFSSRKILSRLVGEA